MAKNSDNRNLRCSFCGKSQSEVKKLIQEHKKKFEALGLEERLEKLKESKKKLIFHVALDKPPYDSVVLLFRQLRYSTNLLDILFMFLHVTTQLPTGF